MEIKIIPSILKRGRYIKYIKNTQELDFIPVETMNKNKLWSFYFLKLPFKDVVY